MTDPLTQGSPRLYRTQPGPDWRKTIDINGNVHYHVTGAVVAFSEEGFSPAIIEIQERTDG